ncbi:MAG: radical SAM protein [Alphaproteobacteria bacterium]|nr:radical SAM protein [Alphaproteobacteria bacterium]
MTDFIRINNFIPSSTVNGPGKRFVIWTQGCNLNCEGCFNRETHKLDGGFLIKISKLADLINNTKDIRGITFSGGEPLLQVNEIIKLIELVNKSLDIFIFSGYTIKEVISDANKKNILKKIDAGLFGRYNKLLPHSFYGKKLVLCSDKIKKEEVKPWINTEIIFEKENVFVTGLY